MARLSILSLGALHLALDDAPLNGFDSDKARGLLVYLAIESDREHPRESLAGLLWPEFPEQHARHTLSQALYNVRQVIGDRDKNHESPFLRVTSQTLQFNPASHHWVDVTRFVAPLLDSASAMSHLEASAALYRGHFLEGFSLGDSPAFEEWVLMQRERLQRAALEIFTRLAAGYAQQCLYDRALFYAWQQLDLDPWREDAHRQVMRLLALSGRRTAALAHYDACRRKLLDELGVEPEAETAELYAAVKAGEFEPSSPRTPMPRHNLPAQLTPLVGRETELASVRMRLQDPACRLLTLIGPGGIGKTRLALEAVKPMVSDFSHGVFFVDLTPLQSADAIVPTVARILNFTFSDKGGSQEQQLLAYLKNKALLLVLDNVEHLLSPASVPLDVGEIGTEHGTESVATVEVIARLLEVAPDVKIVATSRTPLDVLGEHRFPVGELAYPQQVTAELAAVQDVAAVRLFIQSARQSRPDFALAAHNAQAVSDICRYVQGVPLAILLTAAWSATLSTADIAALLTGDAADGSGRGLDLLATDWHNVPPRHRSLRAVFEHSWRLLPAHEQDVFRVLSVFRGGFTLAAAQAVADATPRALRALVNASFLHREASGRYTMQELLRQYAIEKLADDPMLAQEARDRHCAYYIAALQRWTEDAKGPRQQDVLLEMDIEIGNAHAAWDWAVAQGDIAHIDQAAQGLGLFYQRRIRRPEGEAAYHAAVERLEALSSSTPAQEAERLRVLSKVLTWQSRFLPRERAYDIMERVLALLERPELASLDMRAEQAAAWHRMGGIMMGTNREEAKRLFEQSLVLYQATHSAWEESQLLCNLGWLAWHTGNYTSAQQYHEMSLSIAQALGDTRGLAWTIQGLSGVALSRGQVEEGARLSQESLMLRREIGDPVEIADGLYSLAFKYISLGRSIDAVPLLEECKTLTCDQLGLPGGYVHSVLAYAKMLMGQYKPAYSLAQSAARIVQEFHDQRGIGWVYHILGGIALGLDEFAEAENFLRASVEAYRPLEQRQELTFALAFLSYVLWAQGRLDEMRPLLEEVLHIWQAIGSPQSLMFALVGMALLSVSSDEPERAIELYALASRLSPCIENCHWFWDVAGRHIEDAAEALSPESIVEAQARGLARDVQTTVVELLALLQDE